MMSDRDHDAGAFAGIERGLRVGLGQRERLLAIDVFVRRGSSFDLSTVFGVRRRQDDGLNRWIRQNVFERGANGELMLDRKIAHAVGFQRHAARETDWRADIACRLHQSLAPPTEADYCRVQHLDVVTPAPVRPAA